LEARTIAQRLPQIVIGLLLLALLLYGLVLLAIWWKQEKLLFAPTVLPQSHVFKVPPDVQERFLEVEGAKLSALHLRLPKPKAVVLFLHGNGGSLDNWFVNGDFYRSMNVDLLMIDYRGYGKSSGVIASEQQLHDDVARTFALLKAEYPTLPVVLIGRSLGTGLASKLFASLPKAQRPVQLILVSPFFNLSNIAALHFPFVPTFLLRYPMRSDVALASLEPEPKANAAQKPRVLLLHGDQDKLIPLEQSERLIKLQPQAQLTVIRGGGHNDLQEFPAYLDAIRGAVNASIP
jgi:uncharacterized protein